MISAGTKAGSVPSRKASHMMQDTGVTVGDTTCGIRASVKVAVGSADVACLDFL